MRAETLVAETVIVGGGGRGYMLTHISLSGIESIFLYMTNIQCAIYIQRGKILRLTVPGWRRICAYNRHASTFIYVA